MYVLRYAGMAAVAAVLAGASADRADAQWQIDSKDGKTNIKIGFLAQPQAEIVDTPDGTGQSKNVYLRRIRIMFGGKVAERWTFFFETDSPNVGKTLGDKASNPTGAREAGNIYIQDAYLTYNQADWLKVDAGMMLIPLGHNHNQSAATLLPIDYGAYSCTEGSPIGARAGRDYGVQVRGYPLGQHLEYRLGVFAGLRGSEARNSFRVAGRAVWYPFAAESGFFYAGTFQGSKRLIGIGAGFDAQDDYHSYAADVFVEQPINDGAQGLTGTGQLDALRRRHVPSESAEAGHDPDRSGVPFPEGDADAARAVHAPDVRQSADSAAECVAGGHGVLDGGPPAEHQGHGGPAPHRRPAGPHAGAGAAATVLLLRPEPRAP